MLRNPKYETGIHACIVDYLFDSTFDKKAHQNRFMRGTILLQGIKEKFTCDQLQLHP
jgi:hypothetical protein